jgi:hypothetical protein
MHQPSLFRPDAVLQLRGLLKLAGTSAAHSEAVHIEWPDGRGHDSYRVTPEVKAEFEALRVGVADGEIGEGG